MPTICVGPPIPTFSSLLASVRFPYPPAIPIIPSLPPIPGIPPLPTFALPIIPAMPSLPSPLMPDIAHPNFDVLSIVQEVLSFSMLNVLNIIIGKFSSLLSIPFPPIPGINLALPDLLAFNPDAIILAIREALSRGFDFAGIIPTPLMPKLISPSIQAVLIAKMLTKNYINIVMDLVIGKIGDVIGILALPGIPAFPTFVIPTMPDIHALILETIAIQIPTIPEIPVIPPLPGIPPIPPLPVFNFAVPGFPSFAIPTPLIPNFKNPSLEIAEMSNILLGELSGFVINKLTKYLLDFLGILGFSFPEVCLSF